MVREEWMMGNMSTLEEKVDALIRFCVAESDAVRSRCRVDLCNFVMSDSTRMVPDVRQIIDQMLMELAVPDHLLGYGYLRTAIDLAVQDPEAVHYVTGILYPKVAQCHGATPQMVDRSVRHAIQCGWDHCDQEIRRHYFGPSVGQDRMKPTNSQYIARLANRIRRQIVA